MYTIALLATSIRAKIMVNNVIDLFVFFVYNVFTVGFGGEEQPSELWRRTVVEVQTAKRIKANLDGRRTVPARTSKYRRNHFPRYFFCFEGERGKDE